MRMVRRLGLALVGLVAVALVAIRVWPEPDYRPYELSVEERAFVDRIDVPAFAPDWRFSEYESFDGTRLRWGETGNADTARATLLYIPGYNGTLDAYAEQFGMWAREGWHVVGLDLRGQGGSAGEASGEKLAPLTNGDTIPNARDIMGFVEHLAISDRPLILVGSSYGGFMTTLAVLEKPELADGYVALVPAYLPRMPDGAAGQLKLASVLGFGPRYSPGQGPWKPFGTDFTPPDFCPTDSPRVFRQVRIQADDPTQRVGGVTVAFSRSWLDLYERLMAGEFGTLSTPTVMVTVPDDALVENAPIETVCGRSETCRLESWSDSQHCVTLDHDPVVMRVLQTAESLLR